MLKVSKILLAHVEFPFATSVIDGLEVGSNVSNTDSIRATYNPDEYKILKGIRSIPMSILNSDPKHLFYAKNDFDHAKRLAEAIEYNGRIDPLILVVDPDSDLEGPYIMEGIHRLAALHILGKSHFPALVVEAYV